MSRLKSFVEWLTQTDSEEESAVDVEYLTESSVEYKYMSVDGAADSMCRCDLCGRQFALESFPDLVEHVATHDEHGAAEIDPFEHAEQQTVITKDMLEEVGEWRAQNINEVDA